MAEVEQNFATNVREYREQLGLSQEDLAQRMVERGSGFTQATVWKIEQGKRAVRIAEAVALMDALGLPSWMNLTRSPHAFRRDAQLQAAHRYAGVAYAAIKDATAEFLRAQAEVAVAAHEAREAGVAVNSLWTSWLEEPAERAVIEARIAYDREDAIHQDLHGTVSTIMAAIRASGYEPVSTSTT
ncbi:helix-turn-helix transcriptional regulator [Pseudonocardia sp. KRD-184]|uniref:Helix-turn-helix transcriptional regulator n=1 Tax=Pseudonocardia oceani TaxID=2792013 RepID=A0ABS6UJV3_9PSEU|nr:helix-turn-helix transcriptional regulator [Pseudonocardia oceani]MBW0098909.1 helix-turn-helix transcriptional regulator [Pseudonocardia oceani]MBW0108136.1 helix-turn-helix transcriptional regulator [Pseudonocardia oceani]MBW0124815.1 helix-turn-helix transcriptional regulator [Pseudonocardia oceani]MBW0132544.1 helix-turn-helix transcriptional regulator [Pseudonocardia oceani]